MLLLSTGKAGGSAEGKARQYLIQNFPGSIPFLWISKGLPDIFNFGAVVMDALRVSPKKILAISVSAAFMFLAGQNTAESKELVLPVPAVQEEAAITYYLGNMAIDLPESLETNKMFDMQFFSADDAQAALITFGEGTRSDGLSQKSLKDWVLSAKSKPGAGVKSEILLQEDLEAFFNHPSSLVIFKEQENLPSSLSGVKQTLEYLNLIIHLEKGGGVLEFNYSKQVQQWPASEHSDSFIKGEKDKFLTWVKDFVSQYEWLGHNEASAAPFFSTSLGRIKLPQNGKGPLFKISLQATRINKFDGTRPTARFKFSLSNKKTRRLFLTEGEPRIVGGRAGLESVAALKAFDPPHALVCNPPGAEKLDLQWAEAALDEAGNFNPYFCIRFTSCQNKGAERQTALDLGTWEKMLSSVRFVE